MQPRRERRPIQPTQREVSLIQVLREVRDLLETYAPVWFTQELSEKIDVALRTGNSQSMQ